MFKFVLLISTLVVATLVVPPAFAQARCLGRAEAGLWVHARNNCNAKIIASFYVNFPGAGCEVGTMGKTYPCLETWGAGEIKAIAVRPNEGTIFASACWYDDWANRLCYFAPDGRAWNGNPTNHPRSAMDNFQQSNRLFQQRNREGTRKIIDSLKDLGSGGGRGWTDATKPGG